MCHKYKMALMDLVDISIVYVWGPMYRIIYLNTYMHQLLKVCSTCQKYWNWFVLCVVIGLREFKKLIQKIDWLIVQWCFYTNAVISIIYLCSITLELISDVLSDNLSLCIKL